MDTAKGILSIQRLIIQETFGPHLSRIFVDPSAQSLFRIKKQITGSFTATGEQGSYTSVPQMKVIQFFQIHIRKNIHIMHKEGFIGIFKESTGFSDSSPRIEQQVPFVGNMQRQSEIIVSFQKINNLLTEMMDINHYFGKTGSFQFQNHMLQHRTSGHGNKGFGHRIGQWFQPAAQPGCKYHCFHYTVASKVRSIFCSRCTSSTFTPNLRFRCSARCCAE